jgi:hypothetical protein
MKALTLIQPWASLVAIGAKRVETRGWRTSYRGPLAIASRASSDYRRLAVTRCPQRFRFVPSRVDGSITPMLRTQDLITLWKGKRTCQH